MRFPTIFFGLALLLNGHQVLAQLPAIISAPVAEGISRKQITHQVITSLQMTTGKGLAAQMTAISGQIKGVMDATQQLHDTWYSSLLAISSGVRNYRRVVEIYDAQASMIKQYAAAPADLARRGLSVVQLTEAHKVYASLLTENVGLIEELVSVISPGKSKMTDPDRLEFINKIANQMSDQQELMGYFTSKCQALASQQRQSAVDAQALQVLTSGK